MGCDIHSYAEKEVEGKWVDLGFKPFDWRSYSMYGFLAGIRNYSDVTPISEPRGLPEDSTVDDSDDDFYLDGHSASWLSVEELLNFNYDTEMEDKRVTINGDGGCTCAPGEGKKMTYKEFLGENFFKDLNTLKKLKAERIVFYFDN